MKILFVINTLGRGGAETALVELLRKLGQRRYEISLYVMLGQGELADRLPENVKLLNSRYKNCSVLSARGRMAMAKTAGISFFRNGNLGKKTAILIKTGFAMLKRRRFSADKLFWRILSEGGERLQEEYDLAVAYLEGASAYFVADHVKAVKKAAFIHTDYGRAGYTRQMDQGCYEVFEPIFAISQEVRDSFLEVYPEYGTRMRILHNMIDQERIRRLAEESGGFADDYCGFRILTVGRLTVPKAYDIAMQALALLKQEGFAVRWYVLGEGDQRTALEKQRAELGLKDDFILLGAEDNPFPYYRQCDLYVHATRYEGRSIAIQEAQTLGCAILASDCDSNRGQIREGIDGRLCRLTPESIAAGIQELMGDKEQRKRLGLEAARRTMDSEKDLAQWTELLEAVAGDIREL